MKGHITFTSMLQLPLLILGGAVAFSQSTGPDARFAQKAAAGGMAEVKLGQLAQEKGSNPAVKEFGKRMEVDHSKAGDRLRDVASKNNISLPSEMEKKDEETYNRLSK